MRRSTSVTVSMSIIVLLVTAGCSSSDSSADFIQHSAGVDAGIRVRDFSCGIGILGIGLVCVGRVPAWVGRFDRRRA